MKNILNKLLLVYLADEYRTRAEIESWNDEQVLNGVVMFSSKKATEKLTRDTFSVLYYSGYSFSRN